MYITAGTLDDLLHRVISKLLTTKNRTKPTRGEAAELTGVLLRITNPRARLSRTEKKGVLFSCLGELLWYLAKTNDVRFISYYVPRYKDESDDGRTVHGGYGPRLFNMKGHNQVANILTLLRKNPDSRRAVIQLFDAADIARKHKEIPCTCTLQFMIRHRRLYMFTNMRSNDAFIGLPHDVFAFTMLQEIMARSLGLELGTYKHAVGSLHLYEQHRESAQQYLEEGWQATVVMPPMPLTDPWNSIRRVLTAEHAIRRRGSMAIPDLSLDMYWADLVRLLQIYRHFKKGGSKEIARLKRKMSSHIYDTYIEQKRQRANKRSVKMRPSQLPLL
jgi:thymidylate synthase